MGTDSFSRTNFYLTMSLVNLISIGTGTMYSWTSPTLPFLMSPGSFLAVDQNAASWIASLFLLGGAVGPLFAGTVLQTIGFKRTFIICDVCMLMSWLALSSTWSLYILYAGRFLSGITAGVVYLTTSLYIGEISEDHLRGAMNSILVIFRCFGIFLEYAIGPFVSYHQLILINSLGPLLYLVGSFWMPESPYYLISRGKKEEALRTVSWLRSGIAEDNAKIITDKIEIFIERDKTEKKSIKDLFVNKVNIKALLISSPLLSLQQLSGAPAMLIYAQQVFSITGGDISPSTSASIFGLFYFLGSVISPFVAKRFGFRKPLITFGITQCIALIVLGIYMFYYSNGFDVSMYTWCPIFCVLFYAITFNIALGPMPWGIMGEIFSPNIKGKAASVSTSVAFISSFLVTKFFPILSDLLHPYVVFWIFAGGNIVTSLFTILFIPNTKGLSLDQIQNKLSKATKTKDKNENVFVIA